MNGPTFVFVHGGSSNAKAWVPLQRELALLGHRSLAVDLPGHGSDAPHLAAYHQSPQDLEALATVSSHMARLTIADNVNHVVDIVRRIARYGPVILVGNSMGGITISAVGNAIPELLARIVYISAACLVDGADSLEETPTLLDAAVVKIIVADPEQLGAARLNFRAAFTDRTIFAELKAAIMADGTDDQFAHLLNTMDSDEMFIIPTQTDRADAVELLAERGVVTAAADIGADSWGRVPHSYLRLTEDQCIPIAVQDEMIANADALTPDNPFDVHTLAASHVGYFSQPAEFAKVLDALVARPA